MQATDVSAENLEVYVQGITTQLRRILGTATWRDDPPADLDYLFHHIGVQKGDLVCGEELSGPKNGINLVFHTAHPFEPGTIRVFWNGVRLHSGIGYDFVVSDSGGAGAGLDTITFAESRMAPRAEESVYADYLKRTL